MPDDIKKLPSESETSAGKTPDNPANAEMQTHTDEKNDIEIACSENEATNDANDGEDASDKDEKPCNNEYEGEKISETRINIEHFSDYRSAKETALDDGTENSGEDETYEAEQEYENLTILGDEDSENNENLPPMSFPDIVHRPEIKTKDDAKYNEKKPRRVDARFDIIELFVFTLIAIMLITTFFFRHSVVNGKSMMNTLQDGDHLIVSDLFYTPKQYDIVVVDDPEAHDEILVKRVIAIGGQHVRIENMREVYVDDKPVSEEFIYTDASKDTLPIKYPLEFSVPEGYIFIMGDHRNDSYDSRWFGVISEDAIVGKVLVRFYPDFTFFNDEEY